MKKRFWIYAGHSKGTPESDRELGSVHYLKPISKKQALARIRYDYPAYTIVDVK